MGRSVRWATGGEGIEGDIHRDLPLRGGGIKELRSIKRFEVPVSKRKGWLKVKIEVDQVQVDEFFGQGETGGHLYLEEAKSRNRNRISHAHTHYLAKKPNIVM